MNNSREDSSSWVIIPARGGSVGIPRKNLRLIHGKPLISYVIQTALQSWLPEHIIVITDDNEIAHVAHSTGATVVLEQDPTPANETLDTKILRNVPLLRDAGAMDEDILLTIQPTSPLLSTGTLLEALRLLKEVPYGSIISVADDRHLRWGKTSEGIPKPLYEARVNRQKLPAEYRETGGIIATRLGDLVNARTRIVPPVGLLQLDEDESVDIDSYSDLYSAAHLLSRKKIAVRVDASKNLGMGHAYRMLAFASEMSRHDLKIVLRRDRPLGLKFFSKYPYTIETVQSEAGFLDILEDFQPDLIVLDLLDSSAEHIEAIRSTTPGSKIVTFEDRGPGAIHTDLLITEFVTNEDVPESKKLAGIDYALLSPAFETRASAPRVESFSADRAIILFGGTDPQNLARKALESLSRVSFEGQVTVVRGLGADKLSPEHLPGNLKVKILEDVQNMAEVISEADFAYTSAGRTILELISQGVPGICLAQNEKELSHTHATSDNGIDFLGLGSATTNDQLDEATWQMIHNHVRRRAYHHNAQRAGARRSNKQTVKGILDRVGFEDFPEI